MTTTMTEQRPETPTTVPNVPPEPVPDETTETETTETETTETTETDTPDDVWSDPCPVCGLLGCRRHR